MNNTIVWSKLEKSEGSAYSQFITEIFEVDFSCMETRLSELSPMPSSKKGTVRPLKKKIYIPYEHKTLNWSCINVDPLI